MLTNTQSTYDDDHSPSICPWGPQFIRNGNLWTIYVTYLSGLGTFNSQQSRINQNSSYFKLNLFHSNYLSSVHYQIQFKFISYSFLQIHFKSIHFNSIYFKSIYFKSINQIYSFHSFFHIPTYLKFRFN